MLHHEDIFLRIYELDDPFTLVDLLLGRFPVGKGSDEQADY
jgi:hypothetical protein